MESSTIDNQERNKLNFALRPALNEGLRRNREVKLISNYLKVSFRPNNYNVRQYFIKFEPEIAADNETLKRKILREVGKELRADFSPYISSGDSLFSARNVDAKITLNYDEPEKEGQKYTITIEKTDNEIDLTNIRVLNNFSYKVKSFIEIVFKNILNANQGMIRFNNKNIFDYNASTNLKDSDKAFLIPGYSTNVCITESGIYLRAGIKNKFINGKTCLEKIEELQTKYRNGEFVRAVSDFFKNQSVMTTYGTYRVYKIDAVSFDLTVNNKDINVRDKDGCMTTISLFKYYKIQYDKIIKKTDQPLLISYKKLSTGENDPIYLIPELCYLTGMDDEMRLNDSLKKNMTRGTKTTPKDRMDKIYKIRELIYKKNQKKKTRINRQTGEEYTLPDPDDIRSQWGLNVTEFKEFNGRLLESPQIMFSGEIVDVNNGKFRSKRLINPVHLHANSWIVICSQRNLSIAQQMTKSLQTCSEQMGVEVDIPKFISYNVRQKDEIEDYLESLKLESNTYLRIVLIVLDNFTKDYYGNIKRFLFSRIGIPSQVVLKENSSKNLSYYSNVLNQMVSKMGGCLYKIHLDDALSRNPSMVIGYDSVKFGKGKRKYVMTASYDNNFSKFYTEEIIVDDVIVGPVNTLVRKCLDYFLSIYKTVLPVYIFIYRSGVSDREKELILNNEVSSLVNLLSGSVDTDCYRMNYNPKFCFLIVNKRTEAKFFEYDNGNVNNPKSGTVIDTQVTTPGAYEFYLQPQFVNQGTATPSHFHCIYDSTSIPIEILENITNKMCYYYWNWPGAIREPAALKFAEVANKFSTTFMRDYVRDQLKNSPYYI